MSTNLPNLKQIGGGHRKNGQKFVDLMWNDPYVMFRKDRIGIRGGGVLLYIKDTIPA